jgi:hypothetical protein
MKGSCAYFTVDGGHIHQEKTLDGDERDPEPRQSHDRRSHVSDIAV